MRILVLGINYWPEDTGIAVFNTGRCEFLAARGHDVTMCTAFPYYPWWRVPGPYRRRLFSREVRRGVTVLRSYIYVPRRVSSATRVLHEASFIASSFLRAAGRKRPDVIMTVSPPLGLAVTSRVLSRLWRVPYVFHVPDLQPDAALELGMLPRGRVTEFLYGVERMGYRHAALVSTLTEPMRQRIVAKGIPAVKTRLFSDWADPALFDVPLAEGGQNFRDAFGLGDRFVVLHAGNMGVKQGLDVVLDAALLSREDPRIVYLLVGDGAVRSALETRAEGLGLTNVRFLPLQPKRVFLDMLGTADVCLVTQQRCVADIVFPSKVLTLLAAGRPVLASLNPTSEVARVVTEAGAGMVVGPENPQGLLDGVMALCSDPERRITMGQTGRTYARGRWSVDELLPEMETQLLAVARGEVQPARRFSGSADHRVTGAREERVSPLS